MIMVIGIALHKGAGVSAGFWIFYFGLFGFAGGITNWIAIKMLFDEIPGVYGSGIIPKQFKQIRTTIKRMVMETFFEPKVRVVFSVHRQATKEKTQALTQKVAPLLISLLKQNNNSSSRSSFASAFRSMPTAMPHAKPSPR